MACIYNYKGTDYTYSEFRAKLADGLLSDLVEKQTIKDVPNEVVQLFSKKNKAEIPADNKTPVDESNSRSNIYNVGSAPEGAAAQTEEGQAKTEEPIIKADEGTSINNESVAAKAQSIAATEANQNKQGAEQEEGVKQNYTYDERRELRALRDKIADKEGKLKKNAKQEDINRYKELSDKVFYRIMLKPNDETLLPLLDSDDFAVRREVVDYNGATENALLKAVKQQEYPLEVALRAVRNKNATEKVWREGLKHTESEVRYAAQEALDKNSITSNTNQDAVQVSSTEEVLQRQPEETGKTGSERSGVEQQQQGEKIAKQSKPKKKINRTKASGNLRKLSENIRKDGLMPHWAKADLPEGTQSQGFGGKSLDEAVAKALELVADAIDGGANFADSVEGGFAHLKDYYSKNTKSFDEAKIRRQFVGNIRKQLKGSDQETVGISHANTQELRTQYDLGKYERNNSTDAELGAAADELIKKGYPAEALVAKLEKGGHPSGIENFILAKYQANVVAQVEKNPSQENISKLKRVVDALDKMGSLQSESFRTRNQVQLADDSLGAFFIREMDARQTTSLTDEEKAQVEKEYREIKEAEKQYQEKIAALEKENAKLKAAKKVRAIKERVAATKKTHKDFVEERKQIIGSIREKLKAARTGQSGLTAVPVPYAAELFAIAPDVAKLVKSLVEEGVVKLADVVKEVHGTLKEDLPEITEKDVHNIIAGEYANRKLTRTEAAIALADLRTQAQLINRLEKLQNGEEPKSERKKSERSQEIKDLQRQIAEFEKNRDIQLRRTPQEIALSAIKSRTQSEIRKIEEQIKNDDFTKEVRQPAKLDQQALDLKDKLIELRRKRETRLIQQEYARRSKWQKFKDNMLEVLNVPRTIMSSLDYSAPLRQALIATIAHPTVAMKAGGEMFLQGFSQKRFDRWFHDLRETPRYQLMEQSGLYVADPHDPRLTTKEEAFMNNLAEKIPLAGALIKGSERAYVSYLNKMRVDLFNRFTDFYEDQGKTFSNDPQFYKDLANFINNSTGRGNLGFAESASPVLNSIFFSPRLIGSRINLLTDFVTFGRGGKMHPEVRKIFYSDMLQFIGAGLSVLGTVAFSNWVSDCKDQNGEPCVTIELDPRSTDFGKIVAGNMRWDIWGGFQQYIRVISQVLTGETKSTRSGKIESLSGEGVFGKTEGEVGLSFVRGKLAPIPSAVVDLSMHRTAAGEKADFKTVAMDRMLPLIASDMNDAIEDKGLKAIFIMGIPSTFGVGVSTYLPRGYEGKDVKKDPVYSFLHKKSMTLSDPPLKDVPDDKQSAYLKKREQIFKDEWEKVIKYGALLDKKGKTTTEAKKAVRRKDTDALTYDDYSNLMRSISTKSTRRAKKALGIEVE